MKPGDLIKFGDYSHSAEGEIVGLIVDMNVRPWNEVTNVKVMFDGETFWIFKSQIIGVINDCNNPH